MLFAIIAITINPANTAIASALFYRLVLIYIDTPQHPKKPSSTIETKYFLKLISVHLKIETDRRT